MNKKWVVEPVSRKYQGEIIQGINKVYVVMASLEFLRSHALFGGITDKGLEKIRSLLKEERFSKNEIIIRENEQGDRLYFLCKGSVEILKEVLSLGKVRLQKIAALGEGDTFGEMGLIDVQARAATVKALEDTIALTLSNKDLYRIAEWDIETFTLIVMNLAREISRRLRRMDTLAASSLFSNTDRREEKTPHQQPVKE
ncbi:MAG: cyclic nucleotide-binding domain-containing protein [Candidatus Auribacterota bacterium]|nr:cyclic nucleotide-binding domain-containing protein [Candidatus Auribacterota bacterium]